MLVLTYKAVPRFGSLKTFVHWLMGAYLPLKVILPSATMALVSFAGVAKPAPSSHWMV